MSQTAVKTAAQTYADLCAIADEKRYEVIDGVIYAMSPAPRINHHIIQKHLFRVFDDYFRGKACQPYFAPVDVFFVDEGENIENCKNVVEPDLFVLCDKTKLRPEGCLGAPDFIVEILSPSSRKNDLLRKLNLYSDFGVKEYWVVDPDNKVVMTCLWEDGVFNMPEKQSFDRVVYSRVFKGLEVDFSEIEMI